MKVGRFNQIKIGTLNSDGTVTDQRHIRQDKITAECWSIQMWGKEKCKTCEYLKTKACGGKDILKTGKNTKGFEVPVQ